MTELEMLRALFFKMSDLLGNGVYQVDCKELETLEDYYNNLSKERTNGLD